MKSHKLGKEKPRTFRSVVQQQKMGDAAKPNRSVVGAAAAPTSLKAQKKNSVAAC